MLQLPKSPREDDPWRLTFKPGTAQTWEGAGLRLVIGPTRPGQRALVSSLSSGTNPADELGRFGIRL